MRPTEEIIERCRTAGMRMTPQRRAIFDVLVDNQTHPTAEDVLRAVRRRYRDVSLATVYNTLETLHALGEISRHRIDEGGDRFDPEVRPHHHFRCTSCGKVSDAFGELDLPPLTGLAGCSIARAELVLSGECPDCRKATPDKKSKPVVSTQTQHPPKHLQGEHS